jgi:hypothetical protein
LKKDKSNKKKAKRHKTQSVLIQGLTPYPFDPLSLHRSLPDMKGGIDIRFSNFKVDGIRHLARAYHNLPDSMTRKFNTGSR